MEFVVSLAIWAVGIAAYWLIMRYVILYKPEEQPA
jgi:hypothetical protein